MQSKQTIAAFDFDGTITTKDTLFDFIAFYFGKKKLLAGLIILSPMLVFYKLGFIKNNIAKEKLFSYFFKNTPVEEFNSVCCKYSKRINTIIREKTIERIKWHQQQGHLTIIISASVKNWIAPWAEEMNFDKILATEISVQADSIIGKFSSKNCYGQEKVNRLLREYPDKSQYTLYAYGDSNGDTELLKLADYPTLIK